MWENFNVWCLVLGPLKAFWAILQTCQAADTEEMAAVCSLLPGRVLTWLFSSARTLPSTLAIPREHA